MDHLVPAAAVREGGATMVPDPNPARAASGGGQAAEPEPRRDWLTRAGALALAEIIRRYWRDRGFSDVEVWVEPLRGGREPLVVIKSRLGPGGLPVSSPATS